MKPYTQPLLATLLCAALCPLLGGCCQSKIVNRDIAVTLDSNLVGKPVEVDLYAANNTDKESWANVPIEDYFKDGNEMRSGNPNRAVLSFEPGATEATKVFPASDKLWETWKRRGGWNLVILAEIPGSMGSWKGDPKADPRRQVIPLSSCYWDDPNSTIQIQVHNGSISVESPVRTNPR